MTLMFCSKCNARMIPVIDAEGDLVDKCPNCNMTPEEFNRLNRFMMQNKKFGKFEDVSN